MERVEIEGECDRISLYTFITVSKIRKKYFSKTYWTKRWREGKLSGEKLKPQMSKAGKWLLSLP